MKFFLRHRRRAAAAALLLAVLLGSGFLILRSTDPDTAFESFTRELFRESVSSGTLTLHYTLAHPEVYGIREIPVSYGACPEASRVPTAASLENAFAALNTFPRESLSYVNRLTWDILAAQLPRELALLDFPYYEEVFSPLLGIQAQLPVLLAEYEFRSPEDVDIYLKLLSKTDAYFEELLAYEQQKAKAGLFMTDETLAAVISGCRDLLEDTEAGAASEGHFLETSFSERLLSVEALSDRQLSDYVNRNREVLQTHVFPAYELLIEGMTALQGSGQNPYGLCYTPRGRAYYQALLDAVIGSGRSLSDIRSLIDRQLHTDAQLMARLVQKRPELLTDISYTIPMQDPQQILEALQTRIRDDFPAAASDITISVKSVSPSLQAHLSPAFYLTPPLDDMQNHVIYMNPGADYDALALFTTLAHEGFPGHLYQTLWEQNSSQNPVQSLFYFGGYTEGWATYAERLSYRYCGLDPDLADLLAAHSFFLLGLYARSDIGIHYEGWTPAKLNAFWNGYGITDSNILPEIYQAVLQDPANYLKYYLGAVEILELRKEAEELMGTQFSLKDFHRFLLVTGPAPFSVLRSHLSEWTNSI